MNYHSGRRDGSSGSKTADLGQRLRKKAPFLAAILIGINRSKSEIVSLLDYSACNAVVLRLGTVSSIVRDCQFHADGLPVSCRETKSSTP